MERQSRHEDRKCALQQREVKRGSEADLSLQGHRLLSGLQVPLLYSLLELLQDKTEQQESFTA